MRGTPNPLLASVQDDAEVALRIQARCPPTRPLMAHINGRLLPKGDHYTSSRSILDGLPAPSRAVHGLCEAFE